MLAAYQRTLGDDRIQPLCADAIAMAKGLYSIWVTKDETGKADDPIQGYFALISKEKVEILDARM